MLNKTLFTTALASLALAGSAGAMVLNPVGVTGHDGGNWPGTLGHLTDMLNGNNVGFLTGDHNPGMITAPTVDFPAIDPADPATWLYSTAATGWQGEWKANSVLDSNTSINNKIGWAVIDLGSVTAGLDNMFLWNVRYQTNTENTDTYNIYYSSGAGIDALPAMPNSKGIAGDYDFSSGDWTLLNSGGALTLPQNTANNNTPQSTVALGGLSAQYIAIEILTSGAPTQFEGGTVKRVGIAQVEITSGATPAVPGDTDGDGDIDDTDLGTSFSNYTGPVGATGGKTAADGDTDADGDVDDTDLGTSFSGYTGPLGPASVPEPTSLALIGFGGLALLRRRRA